MSRCIICKVTLKEETALVKGDIDESGYQEWSHQLTGYHYYPSCGLVYKEDKP